MSNTGTVRAGIYCRISLAAFGDTTKTDDQERICRDLAARLGWDIAGVYTDHSRSAWQRNRKRPDWDRMLGDAERGRINGIIVYHGDRLIRQPFDLELLLNLAYGRGIKLASPTGVRDLSNPDDQFILRIEAAQACRASDDTSRRKKAQYVRWRREGKVRAGGAGGRAFGFETDGVTQVPGECEVVHEAAWRVLAGEAVGAICRDLTARGYVTTTGIPFQHGTLRKLLARPRYAGLMPDGISAAAWPPVLERETWEALRAALDSRAAGFAYASNARKYLLSGIATCGACGHPLRYKNSRGRTGTYQTGYACARPGCRKVWRDQAMLDAYVTRRVLNRLNHPANPRPQAPAAPGLASEFAALTRQLAEVDAALADHTRGTVAALLARREGIEKRLAELRELAAGDAAARIRAAHTGITGQAWDALPLASRRSLVAACFTIDVLPASKRGPGFRTQDVRMTAR
jgi:DNA invertase Pin-like site-specific DNA recombinase